MDGSFATRMPHNTKVRFASCENSGGGIMYNYAINHHGIIQSDGLYSVNLDNYPNEIIEDCKYSNSQYGVQFYIDVNGDNTFWYPDGDIDLKDYSSDEKKDLDLTITHIKQTTTLQNSTYNNNFITYYTDISAGFGSDELKTTQIIIMRLALITT